MLFHYWAGGVGSELQSCNRGAFMAAAITLHVKRANGSATLVLHNHVSQMAKAGAFVIEKTKTLIARLGLLLTYS
ncbi:hypothetical protein AO261_16060 [Pseudomonas avellanae]|nr:hypothetical protein AO261_16060 [Pseudomonas avellanae]POD20650.1 hypothetical protein BKM05_19000 [Pseudomonas avellanae]